VGSAFKSQWKSVDSVNLRNNEMLNNINAPVLKDINNFVDDLKKHIMKLGMEKILYFSSIFDQNKFVKLNKEGGEMPMDTIEEQI
jgi:hypothetical protein